MSKIEFENITTEEKVTRWRKLLDAGAPVVDEENAALFLEDVQRHFFKNIEKYSPRVATIFIPSFRRMLRSFKMHYDPTYKNDSPIGVHWAEELGEEMLKEYGIDIDAELVNVMTLEIERQLKEVSDEVVINFEIEDYRFKIYAKPYEGD